MEDGIKEKIKAYCKKGNMKIEQISIIPIESGYIAKDEHISIMFDKDGNVSSLPMNHTFGKKTGQLIGKGYALCLYIIIALIFIIAAIGSLIK